jgi:transcriptional regulator with XRE-family HTH domain
MLPLMGIKEKGSLEVEMFTGAQVRMARAYLRWSIAELAEKSGVGISTIQRIEGEDGFPAARGGNIDAVYKTLVAAGVTFLPENDEGIGVRGKAKRKGK